VPPFFCGREEPGKDGMHGPFAVLFFAFSSFVLIGEKPNGSPVFGAVEKLFSVWGETSRSC
jgi:hypothetical protein